MSDPELDHELEAILSRYCRRENRSREQVAETARVLSVFEDAFDRAKAETVVPTLGALARRVSFALDTYLDPRAEHDPSGQTECTGATLYVARWDPRRDPLDGRTRERPFDFDYLALEPDVHALRVVVRWNTLHRDSLVLRDAQEVGRHAVEEVTPELVQRYFNRFVDRVLNPQ